jgi:hypothetical protein
MLLLEAEMVAQKIVWGLHFHRSGIRFKSSNLIEKMVSKTSQYNKNMTFSHRSFCFAALL